MAAIVKGKTRAATGAKEVMLESPMDRELHNLRGENQRLRDLLSLLSDLSLKITSTLDLPTVLQDVIDAACDLTGARYGALGVFDDSGWVQEFITHGISQEERAQIGALPHGLGLLGWLQDLQQSLRLDDLSQHPRSVGFPPNHPPMQTFLGAPLRHRDEKLGNVYLTEKAGGIDFTPEDEALLVLFAAHAASAIYNARLHQRVEAERSRAEDERKHLDALVNTSPVGVLVLDAATEEILLVNQETQRLLGASWSAGSRFDQDTIVRRRPDGREYPHGELPIQRALKLGESVRAEEVCFEFPDGHAVLTLVSATPIYSDDGKVTAAIAVIQDISPLEEMEKLRNEFLAVVSHELRTPLTAIKGSAATVLGSRRPLEEAETREFFQIIDEQADRLRDLVDNLLDLTRIEAGSFAVTTEPTGVGELLEEARAAFVRSGGLQEIHLAMPEGLPKVTADRRRIAQVLVNLLSNAGKFSPAVAQIHIQVEHDPVQVTVHVQDQGRGIAREKLPHLFKKFSQVHEDSGSKLAGSGLGLAICKGIVEAHGGRIWVDSPGEGRGTTFSFTLLVAAEPQIVPLPDTTQRAEHLGRVHWAGERTRILAVDDEPRILRYLERSLEEAGYRPIVSSNPQEVTRLVELEEPDLVLLDLMLPGVSGFELLQRIREFSGVPVIFVTARDQDEDTVQALKMGADDYITKPFSPSELLARIEASLRRRLLADQMEVRPPFMLHDLVINFAERRVIVGDQPVSLSATEYKILYELASRAGMALTHDQILQRVWGPEYSGEAELVRSFIRNLRRKLNDNARNPRYILTEPQVGYRMPRP
jgi:PAS domain S-box-containing protein